MSVRGVCIQYVRFVYVWIQMHLKKIKISTLHALAANTIHPRAAITLCLTAQS